MTLGSDIYQADSFLPVNLKRLGDEIVVGSSHAYAHARSSFSTPTGALSGVVIDTGDTDERTPCLTAATQCT